MTTITEPVLDYGAGQGVFLSAALAVGIDAVGCDLDGASRNPAVRWCLTTAGLALGIVGRFWSDTDLAIFQRVNTH